jgi:hypothetical protein
MEGVVARTTPIETAPAGPAPRKREAARTRPEPPAGDHLLVISGLSGAGKSQASKLYEDLGYSVIDNLPAALLDDFLALRRDQPDRYRRGGGVVHKRAGVPAPPHERAAPAQAGDVRRCRRRCAGASGSQRAAPPAVVRCSRQTLNTIPRSG